MNEPAIDILESSRKRLGLSDRLSLINLISDGLRHDTENSPVFSDLFRELEQLVNITVSGAKVDRYEADYSKKGFKHLEINAESGENLARLNMLYLKKPLPCYYLVYVEVASPFRKKGLGNLILKEFRDFLMEKSAVGVLDNIIPKDDPTFDIYLKLEWKSFYDLTGYSENGHSETYMVYLPPAFSGKDVRDPLVKLVHHLVRKRPAIDMRDNELMVQRTIEEFKDLYSALVMYFEDQIIEGNTDAVMRFMFTRFVTKLIGFRRRISRLLGYTGGESMEQIPLHPEIRNLKSQSYAPKELKSKLTFLTIDKELWMSLPEALKNHPARFIETLDNYQRPSLTSWLKANKKSSQSDLTLGDIMDLGFDPTRLKELVLDGQKYIFERVQGQMVEISDRKMELLDVAQPKMTSLRIKNSTIRINKPLLVIKDGGNGYILRKKVEGIHWEEAIEQLQTAPELKELNSSMNLDRLIKKLTRKTYEKIQNAIGGDISQVIDPTGFFVSWDINDNRPKLVVDMGGVYFDSLWIS
jgi:hypothetical protein